MGTIVESGEVLIRMRPRRPEDRLPLPFQLQVMDTETSQSKFYSNTQGAAFPNALDTDAFACN